MTIAFCNWVVLAATVWHTRVCVSVCQGLLVPFSPMGVCPCGCLSLPVSTSVCLLGHVCPWVSFSVPTAVSLGVCVCCANTAVAAWAQWLLREWFLIFFPFPAPAVTQCPPQSREWPLCQVLVSPLSLCRMAALRSPPGTASMARQPLVELQQHNPHSDFEKKQVHTDRWAGDKHRLRVTFTSFFMKLNVAPGPGEDIVQEGLCTCYWIQISLDDQTLVSYSINKHWISELCTHLVLTHTWVGMSRCLPSTVTGSLLI